MLRGLAGALCKRSSAGGEEVRGSPWSTTADGAGAGCMPTLNIILLLYFAVILKFSLSLENTKGRREDASAQRTVRRGSTLLGAVGSAQQLQALPLSLTTPTAEKSLIMQSQDHVISNSNTAIY